MGLHLGFNPVDLNIGQNDLYIEYFSKLITFTINKVVYQARANMTWGEWIESEYNTDGYYIGTIQGFSNLFTINGIYYIAAFPSGYTPSEEDIIVANAVWTLQRFPEEEPE